MSPGSYFTINEGLELECLPCTPGTKAVVAFFTKKLLADVGRTLDSSEKLLLDTPETDIAPLHFFEHLSRQPSQLSDQMQALAFQMAAHDKNDCAIPHELFFSLAENLLSFQGQTRQQINGINARQTSTKEELYRRLMAAHSFMLDQWAAPLLLEDVAQHACLSPYHFHRSFREAFGEAPMRWFRNMKLRKAMELLQSQKLSVSEVALQSGFSDIPSFSKAFRRLLGSCPSAIRLNAYPKEPPRFPAVPLR